MEGRRKDGREALISGTAALQTAVVALVLVGGGAGFSWGSRARGRGGSGGVAGSGWLGVQFDEGIFGSGMNPRRICNVAAVMGQTTENLGFWLD